MRWWHRMRGRRRPEPRDADGAVRAALRAVLDQQPGRAQALLARVVREDSDQVDVYLALASLARQQGEVGRAIRIHQNLLLRTDLPVRQRGDALRGLSRDFQSGGFLRRALAGWLEVLAGAPKDEEALRALFRIHVDLREYERALTIERRLARLERRDSREREASLLVEMALAAQAEGRSDAARRAVRMALKRDSRCVPAWIEAGVLEAERGHAKKALAAWKKVPELDRRAAASVYPRVEATFASLGRARDFEAWLRGLLEARPGDAAARLALARSLAARGDGEAALLELDALLERDPEDLEVGIARARILLADGRDAEAAKDFSELLDQVERRGLLAAREGLA